MCNNARRERGRRTLEISFLLFCFLLWHRCIFPVFFSFFFFPLSLREIRISAPAVVFSLSRARQQIRRTVILVDHTWRAKLSLLTLARDTKPRIVQAVCCVKIDNNISRTYRGASTRTRFPRFFFVSGSRLSLCNDQVNTMRRIQSCKYTQMYAFVVYAFFLLPPTFFFLAFDITDVMS